ncbi:hypothetical protein AS4_02170 [Acinetobacter guillouiae]|uniref:GmrSD restriction endonuclease domain-containing protein n=1 Tax=Acinetobacter guillouiae TaxID=106649 RepID=UPI0004EF5D3F|nr:DUF262 domain-containing protein [Acinetobacter guillouiae]BAP35157.1 hypothetical protein AS4_02170 [Acinetobacter guillouiae]
MDLKGAELRNFYAVSQFINGQTDKNYGVNIPHYQRPYRWDKENVQKLIEDWRDHKQNTDYFSGSIVTVAQNNKAHDLIDGQQRFTTLFLINFLQFLILRELISVSIREDRYFYDYKSLYDEMLKSAKYLFHDEDLLKQLADVKNVIFDLRISQKYSEATILFNKSLFLSDQEIVTDESRQNNLFDGLQNYSLFLKYDRSSFNESLVKLLSHVIYNLSDMALPKFIIYKSSEPNYFYDNEMVYLNAIDQALESFNDIVRVEVTGATIHSYEKATKIKDKINDFLSEVKLCLIQTGNTEDAYTLFEVLNDRALSLDDLDLIKNLFYKNFVLKSSLLDARKDKILQSLDSQWIEKVYPAGIPEAEKKLITYLAVSFITGSTSITHKATKDYRTELNKYFLKSVYDEKEIKRDFNIFESCRLILRSFDLRFRNQDVHAVQAEYDKNNSWTYKLLHILMALKQEGVLAGFSNFLLNYIQQQVPNFEPEKIQEILSKLKIANLADETIEAQAKVIWQTSMLSKDAIIPRQLAVDLIRNNNIESSHLQTCSLPIKANVITPNDEFDKWIEEWRFGSNLKVRVLFARLLTSGLVDDKLVNQFFSIGLTADQVKDLQLDHMEAQNPDRQYESEYFQHDSRDYYINGIGNMMPLPKEFNVKKSNYPLSKSMIYYDSVGINQHFLMVETKKLLENYNDDGRPTEQFFVQRKNKLINWFKQCIGM